MSSASARRVAKSAVDWAKFVQFIPKEEAGVLTQLKSKSDAVVTKVQSLPADLPKIDFAAYKKQVPEFASIIDSFQQQYGSVSIPYPADGGIPAKVDAASKQAATENEKWIADSKLRINEYKEKLSAWEKIPPLEHLSEEEWHTYFPGCYKDGKVEDFMYELPLAYTKLGDARSDWVAVRALEDGHQGNFEWKEAHYYPGH